MTNGADPSATNGHEALYGVELAGERLGHE
jgi:hypothetical protein